jgi:hypothetical protein
VLHHVWPPTRGLLRRASCAVASIHSLTVAVLLAVAFATPAQGQSIQLFWDPPAGEGDVSYRVEGGTAPGVYSATYPVAIGLTTFTVNGLLAGSRYYFVVRAVDGNGAASAPSNEVSVMVTADAPTPPPPDSTTETPAPAPQPPPPAPPTGPTTIAIDSETGLRSALAALRSNTVLLLAPGTYQLTAPLTVTGGVQDVELRGSTGRAEDVILIGPPATAAEAAPSAIVASNVTRLVFAAFTVRDAAGYAVMLGTNVQRPVLRGLRIIAAGEFVRSTLHTNGAGASGGLIEGCSFEYAGLGRNLPTGVDIQGGRDWTLRGNRFMDAQPRERVSFGPSLVAWQGSGGTVVERNVFVNTTREIVLGLDDRTPNQHTGGMVRNNMIVRRAGTGHRGAAVSVLDSPGAVVIHNTALLSGTSSVAVDYAHPDTQNAYIANNLADAPVASRDGASAIVEANLSTAVATMFVAPAQGDLRLRADAAGAAIDQGVFTTHTDLDAEGQHRPAGVAPDIGADEVVQ